MNHKRKLINRIDKDYNFSKSLIALICLIFIGGAYPEANGSVLLLLHEKMRYYREMNGKDDFIKSDSIAAYCGDTSAMIRYGNWCLRNNREQIGKDFLYQAACLDNDTAKCYLAETYYWGIGTEQEPIKALEILKTIKIKEGMVLKGIMAYDGVGCSRDYPTAVEIFSSVSENSFYYSLSCYYLSKCFRYGRGVAKDISKSEELIKMAIVRPLKARNVEETKSKQFWEIVYPTQDRNIDEMKTLQDESESGAKSVNPTFVPQ